MSYQIGLHSCDAVFQAVPFADDSTEQVDQDADCVFCTGRFSEVHNAEEWVRFVPPCITLQIVVPSPTGCIYVFSQYL